VASNDAAAALFGDFGQLAPEDRNILHWMLTDPAARHVFGQTWAEEARRIVSLFRAAHDLWPGDVGKWSRFGPLAHPPDQARHGRNPPRSGCEHMQQNLYSDYEDSLC
jgi:hypothetical protein